MRNDNILRICEKQAEIISQLSDLVHVLLDELSQYRSVEQEEKLLNELENEDLYSVMKHRLGTGAYVYVEGDEVWTT